MLCPRCAALVALVQVFACAAWAQTGSTSRPDAPLHVGPLWVAPSVTLTAATDTNVFYLSEDPQQDFVTLLTPQALTSLRIGPVLVSAKTVAPYTHFATFRGSGGLGVDETARASLLLTRLTPYVEGIYQNLKQRPNFEISALVRQVRRSVAAGTAVRLMPHAKLDVAVRRQAIGYADDAIFLGVNLNDTLSEKVDTVTVTLSRSITPLTDILVSFEKRRDRFDHVTARDADSQGLMVGLQSDALLNGRATVGYREFAPLSPDLPEFKGLVVSAALAYPFFGTTRVAVEGSRDVAYSYDALRPYYIMTSAIVSVTEPVPFGLIVHVRAGLQRSDYRSLTTAQLLPRTDTGTTYSVGLEYRLDRHILVGGSLESYSRVTQTALLRYEGRRLGASLGYVF